MTHFTYWIWSVQIHCRWLSEVASALTLWAPVTNIASSRGLLNSLLSNSTSPDFFLISKLIVFSKLSDFTQLPLETKAFISNENNFIVQLCCTKVEIHQWHSGNNWFLTARFLIQNTILDLRTLITLYEGLIHSILNVLTHLNTTCAIEIVFVITFC